MAISVDVVIRWPFISFIRVLDLSYWPMGWMCGGSMLQVFSVYEAVIKEAEPDAGSVDFFFFVTHIQFKESCSLKSHISILFLCLFIYFLKILFIFRERGREGKGKEEKHQCVGASPMPPTGDLDCNPGICPDWESNQ